MGTGLVLKIVIVVLATAQNSFISVSSAQLYLLIHSTNTH